MQGSIYEPPHLNANISYEVYLLFHEIQVMGHLFDEG